MPEGPEVQRAADRLHDALAGREIRAIGARTKAAKAWLEEHPDAFVGRRVERVTAHGKHLLGTVEGDLFFHSHFLMWGRWHVVAPDDPAVETRDRRERGRIVTDDAAALLYSAPQFDVGRGDPYDVLPALPRLGPDVLPEGGAQTAGAAFDADEFLRRLALDPDRTIGAALLDQTVAAGIGNYLRAEILYACRMDPWRLVGELDDAERACLVLEVPRLCRLAYERGGQTVPDAARERQAADRDLRYSPHAHAWNTRHWVFRRTNLPCLTCDDYVRQKHQLTREWTDDETGETVEKKRIIYFCPTCQGTRLALKPPRPHKDRRPPDSEWAAPDEETDPEGIDA
ncbi:DNA-formamidopyrimidine glycosylase family protein [Rubrivirga litoralis]|uniref:DNA-(apurinic or apyrimidinic site) lyase n=1 Tax=Rubrivirga litoralis TaxID=3075598 RepID=A0ABU3BNP3_9BACT|nr:DNA-formamidopyrimidine glycosylase family protein [Rubrivirga sp. F394]MDT0630895.1 DNA-formamidopyrimidine glycosylase family protein [Rubrivirga sp. F394]